MQAQAPPPGPPPAPPPERAIMKRRLAELWREITAYLEFFDLLKGI